MAYYEICNNVNNKGWEVVQDEQGRIGPYAFKDRQWVGYDDIGMIRLKSEYIRKMGFGGGMVWALDLDDFTNRYEHFLDTFWMWKIPNGILTFLPPGRSSLKQNKTKQNFFDVFDTKELFKLSRKIRPLNFWFPFLLAICILTINVLAISILAIGLLAIDILTIDN